MSRRNHVRRRRNYGRRQHELRQRQRPNPEVDELFRRSIVQADDAKRHAGDGTLQQRSADR